MAITATQIQNLYIAYFGRPAEKAGLDYWSTQTDLTVSKLSASFAQQPEYQAVYGGLARSDVVAKLYQNLFGRAAAGNELNYWISSGDISVDRMALALVNGAQSTDRDLLNSKTEFAIAITAANGSSADIATVKQAFTNAELSVSVNGKTYTPAEFAREVGPLSQFYQLAATQVAVVDPTPAMPRPAPGGGSSAPSTPAPVVSTPSKLSYAVNGQKGLQDDSGSSVSTVLYPASTSAATIKLNDAAGSANIVVDDASTLSSLTLKGTVVAGSDPLNANVTLRLSEDGSTDALSQLTVVISAGSTPPLTTSLSLSNMSGLTTVDASASTTNLIVDTRKLSGLAQLTSGSGDDLLYVRHGNHTLAVNAGAGNDTVKLDDAYDFTAIASQSTIITLGAGQDTLDVRTLSNLGQTLSVSTPGDIANANALLGNSLIKVTDFTAGDKLVFGSTYYGGAAGGQFVSQSASQQQAINSAATLAEALQLAASNAAGGNSLARSTAFQYHGNTYLFLDHALSATVTAGDGLVELTGYVGTLDADNFSFVASADVLRYSIGAQGLQDANGRVSDVRYQAGVSAATIGLQDAQGGVELNLNDASTLTALTLTGSTAAAGARIVVYENYTTDQLATLNLNISGGDTIISAVDVTALTRIDASQSSANLTIQGFIQFGFPAALATLISGSGNDHLIFASGKGAMTVDAGAGNDILELNGAAGSDLNAAYGLSITLGAGNDVLKLNGLGNLLGTFATGNAAQVSAANAAIGKGLIKVSDFSAGDKLDVSAIFADAGTGSLTRQSTAQQNAISNAASLAEALQLAATNVSGAVAHSTLFQFQGNTYLFIDHSTAAGVTAGDGLIELTGFVGTLDSQNSTIAA